MSEQLSPELREHIGKEIQKHRKLRKMTQKDLAEKIGFTNKNSLTNIEAGSVSVSLKTLEKICEVLNLDLQVNFLLK